MNRDRLVSLLGKHDMKCMSTFFQKPNHEKATYRHVWTRGLQGPFTTDWYSEIVFGLIRRLSNSVIDVRSDRNTNIDTDHLALIVEVRQKLKAIVREETEATLKRIRAETEKQEENYNGMVVQGIIHGEAEDIKFHENPGSGRRGETHPKTDGGKEKRLPSGT